MRVQLKQAPKPESLKNDHQLRKVAWRVEESVGIWCKASLPLVLVTLEGPVDPENKRKQESINKHEGGDMNFPT